MTLNYKAIGKILAMDTQIIKTVIEGVIMIIGETLSKEENILIDLGRLGKLHGIQKEVRYYPFMKHKGKSTHTKQTVKVLLDANQSMSQSIE